MTAPKIVLVSHPLGGKLHSEERRADLEKIRAILELIHKDGEVIPIAPYLLYAEITQDLIQARSRCVGWHHNPPVEVWVYGAIVCEAMRCEIIRMRKNGLRVVFMSEELAFDESQLSHKFLTAAE